MTALTRRLGSPAYAVTGPLTIQADGLRDVDTSLIGRLTILVTALAAFGVLNATIMMARERVRDQASELALLALTSLGLAALGSLGPAVWAAVSRTAAVLRTE